MGGAVFVGTLQLQPDLAGAVTFEPFVGDGGPADVAAELLEFLALIGVPCELTCSSGVDGLAWLCRLSTFCPVRGPSAIR